MTGGYRASSRQQAWLQLRRFARYLADGAACSLIRRLSDPNVLLRYKEALLRQKRLRKTSGTRYNFARQLLRWLAENEKDGPWRSAILFGGSAALVRETHNVRDNDLSPQLLHRIASACKHETDQAVERFAVRERVLRGESVPSAELGGIRLDLLRQVLELEAQKIYTQRDFKRIHRGGLAHIGLRRAEPPPEPVCLELIRQAIRLLGPPADDVIRLRNKYILACESAKKHERRRKTVREIATRKLENEKFAVLPGEEVPWTSVSVKHPQAIKRLVAAVEGACATILLFLSGPRVSELYLARPGCLRYLRHSNGIEYPYYFARRSKQKQARDVVGPRYRLDPKNRGWILGPAGVRALEVLERLSQVVRSISKVDSYWASVKCSGLWACTHRLSVTATNPNLLNIRLNVFASVVGLAERTGWRGRLHTHMGRKACARFIAKRDRTALADLALQFGHLSAYVTDASYARPDAEYRRMIDEELAAEMQNTAVELAGLDVARTFSHMGGTQVATLRNRVAHFAGEMHTTADVRRLLGLGVRLVPCDWGMCVYREETSACGGNQFGPSSERRSPVVCRNCINFLATEKHRPYWQRRIEDCERVLALRHIPDQVRRLVKLRMSEAKEVISSISGEVSR